MNGEGEYKERGEGRRGTEREAELGRPRARDGKVFPSESISLSTTPVLAMFQIYGPPTVPRLRGPQRDTPAPALVSQGK